MGKHDSGAGMGKLSLRLSCELSLRFNWPGCMAFSGMTVTSTTSRTGIGVFSSLVTVPRVAELRTMGWGSDPLDMDVRLRLCMGARLVMSMSFGLP